MFAATNRLSFTIILLAALMIVVTPSAYAAIIDKPPSTCGGGLKSHNGTSFGCRSAPDKEASTFHRGTDYACTSGTALFAGAAGTMTCKSRSDGDGAGNRCAIVTDDGCMQLKYFHMDDRGFKAGAPRVVIKGTGIGVSGASGKGKNVRWGAHLHFELWIGTGNNAFPVSSQYFFSKYDGQDVCNNQAAIDDLRKQAREDMASCPGEGGAAYDDLEIGEESYDVCTDDADDFCSPEDPNGSGDDGNWGEEPDDNAGGDDDGG